MTMMMMITLMVTMSTIITVMLSGLILPLYFGYKYNDQENDDDDN